MRWLCPAEKNTVITGTDLFSRLTSVCTLEMTQQQRHTPGRNLERVALTTRINVAGSFETTVWSNFMTFFQSKIWNFNWSPNGTSVCRYYWLILACHRRIGISAHVLLYALILKLFLKATKKVWTGDLKWCNYVVCPAEVSPLFNN